MKKRKQAPKKEKETELAKAKAKKVVKPIKRKEKK